MARHRALQHLTLASVVGAAVLLTAPPAAAATITPTALTDDVSNNGNCTLRESVIAANTNSAVDQCPAGSGLFADTIALAHGTYILMLPGSVEDTDPAASDLDLSGSLIIKGPAEGASIDQQGDGLRVLQILTAANVTLSNLTITGGTSPNRGAGIFNQGSLTLQNVTVTGNTSETDGGGIATTGPTLRIVNSTLSANQVRGDGGALFQIGAGSSSTLSNVTVAGNRADSEDDGLGSGGGVRLDSGDMTFQDTIVAGNADSSVAGGNIPDCVGSITSDGYNLVGDPSGCTLTGTTTGNLTGVSGLGALASNGGPTQTHLPQPGSQVIDAGNPSGCTDGTNVLVTDQRGVSRVDGDGDGTVRCDIGAVEAPGPKLVALKAKPRTVEPGEKTRLKAKVTPCAGHEGDLVVFYRKSKRIATKASNAECVAKLKVKVRATTRFQAASPIQDLDHLEGVSKRVRIKVRKG